MPDARLIVEFDVIREVLRLPRGTTVTAAATAPRGRGVEFTINHPAIKAEAGETPLVKPRMTPGKFIDFGQSDGPRDEAKE